jgi:hypothetical protein
MPFVSVRISVTVKPVSCYLANVIFLIELHNHIFDRPLALASGVVVLMQYSSLEL